MFCAIALEALWRPLGVVSFSVWAPRVLQWSLKKRQKVFKNNGLGRFGGILLGRPTWTIRTKNAFPCSVRLVFHFCKAFPCSVALIFFDEIAFPCRWRSIFIRLAPSGGSGLVCLDRSVWTGLSGSGLSGSGLSGSRLSGSGLSGFRLSGSGLSGSLQSPLPRPPSHHPPRSHPPHSYPHLRGVRYVYIYIYNAFGGPEG